MISNERPSPYGRRPFQNRDRGQHSTPRPPSNEETLKTETVHVERKTFIFTLKENPRGRFLRITEEVSGRRDHIIVPSTGLEDFRRALDEMVRAAGEMPEDVQGDEQESARNDDDGVADDGADSDDGQ